MSRDDLVRECGESYLRLTMILQDMIDSAGDKPVDEVVSVAARKLAASAVTMDELSACDLQTTYGRAGHCLVMAQCLLLCLATGLTARDVLSIAISETRIATRIDRAIRLGDGHDE